MSQHKITSSLCPYNISPPPSPSLSEDDSEKLSSISSLSTPPSSPSMEFRPLSLFRLLPTCRIPHRIKLDSWISITLELLSEFGGFQHDACPKQNFKLKDGQALLPLYCSLLYEYNGQISNQCPPNCNLKIEKRALQSANWLGLESLSGPGIGLSGRGGLEFCVESIEDQTPTVFWICISSGQGYEVVPLVLGPLSISLDSYNTDDSHQVSRLIYIPRWNGQTPRTMLLNETWNNVPQGRIWDSAFVLLELFSRMVTERLSQQAQPVFAGKRILDLSAGTGLLGTFLAGLAQTELELSHSTDSLSTTSSCTTVIMTDLAEALELIEHNISSNKSRIAPNINIILKELVWGASNLRSAEIGELDILVASDVVYEVESFTPLLETLCGLCTPERTVLYLGYKRRHLTEDKESCFFDGIKSKFYVIEKLQELDIQVWCLKKRT